MDGGAGSLHGRGLQCQATLIKEGTALWLCKLCCHGSYGCESSCLVTEQRYSSETKGQELFVYARCLPCGGVDASASGVCLSRTEIDVVSCYPALNCFYEQSIIMAANVKLG